MLALLVSILLAPEASTLSAGKSAAALGIVVATVAVVTVAVAAAAEDDDDDDDPASQVPHQEEVEEALDVEVACPCTADLLLVDGFDSTSAFDCAADVFEPATADDEFACCPAESCASDPLVVTVL